MDKPKSKNVMLAAGKKRLQQFRKEKKNKAGSGTLEIEVENLPKSNLQNSSSTGVGSLEHTETARLLNEKESTNGNSDNSGSGAFPELSIDKPDVELWASSPPSQDVHFTNQVNSNERALLSGQPEPLTVQVEELNKTELQTTSHTDVMKQELPKLADENAESGFGAETQISCSLVGGHEQPDGTIQLFHDVEKREEQAARNLEVYSIHESANENALLSSQLEPFTVQCEELCEGGVQAASPTHFVKHELQNLVEKNAEADTGLERLKSCSQVSDTLQPEVPIELFQEVENRGDQTASSLETYSVHMNSSSNESMSLSSQPEPLFQKLGDDNSEAGTGLESETLLLEAGSILQADGPSVEKREKREGQTASNPEIYPVQVQESATERILLCSQPESLTAQFEDQSKAELQAASRGLFVKQELQNLACENVEADNELERQKSCLEVVGTAKAEGPTQLYEEVEKSEKQTSSKLEGSPVYLQEGANKSPLFPYQPEPQSAQLGIGELQATLHVHSVNQEPENLADEKSVAGTGLDSQKSRSEGPIQLFQEVGKIEEQTASNLEVYPVHVQESADERVLLSGQPEPLTVQFEEQREGQLQFHFVKEDLQSLAEENAETGTGLERQKLWVQVGDNVQTEGAAQFREVEKREEQTASNSEVNPVHVQESTTEPAPLIMHFGELSNKSESQATSNVHIVKHEVQNMVDENAEAGTVPEREKPGLRVSGRMQVEGPTQTLQEVENREDWTASNLEMPPVHVQESANESTLHSSQLEPLTVQCEQLCEGKLVAASQVQNLADKNAEAGTGLEKQKLCAQVIGAVQAEGSIESLQEVDRREEQTTSSLQIYAVHDQESANENAMVSSQPKVLTVHFEEQRKGELQAKPHAHFMKQELQNLAAENAEAATGLRGKTPSLQVSDNVHAERPIRLLQEREKKEEQAAIDLEICPVHAQESANDWLVTELENTRVNLMRVVKENVKFSCYLDENEDLRQKLEKEYAQLKAVLELLQEQLKGHEKKNADHDSHLGANEQRYVELMPSTTMNVLQQQTTEEDANKVSKFESPTNEIEFVLQRTEREAKDALLSSRQYTSMELGVSKLIKAFEAKANTSASNGNDRSATQELHMGSQSDVALHADVSYQLQQLRESDEEKACLVGALRQVEFDKLASQQRIGELETKVALVAEENDQLLKQIEWDTSQMKVLQKEISELQNKSAEQVLHWQAEVEGLQQDLSQLRETEEEKVVLVGALRQLETDKFVSEQRIGELEAKVALVVEENNQLTKQIEWDSSLVEVLQKEIIELQNKSAERILHWQAEVEGLKQDLSQQALALQAERDSYLKALVYAEKGFENADVLGGSDNLDKSDAWNGCSRSHIEMAEVREKIEELKIVYEQLKAMHAEASCYLVTVQQDRDAAIRTLTATHKKLHFFSPLADLAKEEGGSLLEHLQNGEVNEAGGLRDVEASAVDIDDLYHQCSNTIEDWCNALEDKVRLEDAVREMESLLSIKETEIEEVTFKSRDLSENCALMCSRAEKADQEQNAAVKMLSLVYKRLCHLFQEHKNDDEKVHQLNESLRPLEKEDISGVSQEVDVSSINLVGLFQECNSLLGKLQNALEERRQMEGSVRKLEALLSTKEADIEGLTQKVIDLSQRCESMSAEAIKAGEENLSLVEDLKKVQTLYSEQEKMHLKLCSHASALSDRVSAVLTEISNNCNIDVVDNDVMSRLDLYVTVLLASYETACKELQDLSKEASKALVSEASFVPSHEEELEKLQVLLVSKEVKLTQQQEQLLHLTSELDKERENRENKDAELQQADQKLLAVKEKLSLAVTKGKGLVQQRDTLKHLLAEKTAELKEVSSSYKQELELKAVALHEAEMNFKVYAESGERVEALESELSYIRNSANALRESFLQKDAVLQRIEELVEDANLPDELQHKEITEKVECLIEGCNQKQLALVRLEEGQVQPQGLSISSLLPSRESAELSSMDSVSQRQEIEDLNRKNEDLSRKYRSMAEQSAMLEQCLLERNCLVQRWEEVLDTIDMPSSIRSREPEDRIEWLGRAVAEAHMLTMQLQSEAQIAQGAIDTLNSRLKDVQEQNHVLTAEIVEKDVATKKLSMDFEDMALKYKSLSEPASEGNSDKAGRELSEAELAASQNSQHEEEMSESMQLPDQSPSLEALVTHIHTIMVEVVDGDDVERIFSSGSVSTILENSTEFLVKKCKSLSLEVVDLRHKVTELSDLGLAEKERENCALLEQQLQGLQEELEERVLEARKLIMHIEELDSKRLSHEVEIAELSKQVKVLTDELAFARDESAKSQLETNQTEEKLASVREKLSMAVKKGKSVVQQRDAVRQSLDEKTAELALIRQKHQAQILSLDEAEEKLKCLTDTVEKVGRLELELSSSREYAASMEQSLQESNTNFQKFAGALDKVSTLGAPRSRDPLEKIQWLLQALVDVQKRAVQCEQEAKKSKKGAELLALELEEVQGRMDTLTEELMHAEKNSSILIGEKKAAETAKAEAGLRLEHAMANVNSLLFELNELRESKAELERENHALKDSLTAQMGEIRRQQVKAEQQLKDSADLQTKLHSLKQGQAALLEIVADELFRLIQETRRAKMLAAKMSGEFSSLTDKRRNSSSTDNFSFVEMRSFDWRTEATRGETEMAKNILDIVAQCSNSGRNGTEGWEISSSAGSLRKQCEEMENELQLFGGFFKDFIAAPTQDSLTVSQLLLETCSRVQFISETMESLKKDAGLVTVSESSRKEKDRQIMDLQMGFKRVTESVVYSIEQLELLKVRLSRLAQGETQSTAMSFQSLKDDWDILQSKDLQELASILVERLLVTVQEVSSFEQLRESKVEEALLNVKEQFMLELKESERQCEDLKSHLDKAKAVTHTLHQQRQLDRLRIDELGKASEELEANDASLKRTQQELNALRDLLSTKNQEEEGLVQALDEAETKTEQLSVKVDELEQAMQLKQVAILNLEASRGKALSKLSATLNKLDDLRGLSEGLLAEVENLHSLLGSRDLQLSQLREEITYTRNEVTSMQKLVDGKSADLSQFHQRIQDINAGIDVRIQEVSSDAVLDGEAGGTHESLEALDKKVTGILAGNEGIRAQLARKDALLQDTQTLHTEMAGKVQFLQAALQDNQAQIERLKAQSNLANADDSIVVSTEVEEMGKRVKRTMPANPVATHVRGPRKISALDHSAVDVDIEANRSLLDLDDDDKGHVFKPLTSSRLVPRATRILVDRIDGFWVAGERLLMRKPEARLGVIMYWLALHVWMVMLLF